jgi:hypothetical protein
MTDDDNGSRLIEELPDGSVAIELPPDPAAWFRDNAGYAQVVLGDQPGFFLNLPEIEGKDGQQHGGPMFFWQEKIDGRAKSHWLSWIEAVAKFGPPKTV